MPVIDKDKGWKFIASQMQRFRTKELHVGILGAKAEEGYPATVAEYGAFNEYGLGVPERSFMRSTFDEKLPTYQRFIAKGVRRFGPGMDSEKLLYLLGEKMKADIQNKIVKLKEPGNADSTKARKGSSNPLIDTGRLRQSIDYEVK